MKRLTKSMYAAILAGLVLGLCQGCAKTGSQVQLSNPAADLADLGNGICQQRNGLMWQVARSEVFNNARDARDYAENLALGGYHDWRLPSKDEFYSLCNIFELWRAGDCPIKLKGYYWLGDDENKAGQYESYPLCGGSEFRYMKSKTGRVMAVRP